MSFQTRSRSCRIVITNPLYINNRRRNYLDIELRTLGEIELRTLGENDFSGALSKTSSLTGVPNRIASEMNEADSWPGDAGGF
jgi:hypothetical protein